MIDILHGLGNKNGRTSGTGSMVHMGVSINGGPQNRPKCSMLLTIGRGRGPNFFETSILGHVQDFHHQGTLLPFYWPRFPIEASQPDNLLLMMDILRGFI